MNLRHSITFFLILVSACAYAANDSLTKKPDYSNSIIVSAADLSIPHITHSDHKIPLPSELQRQVGAYYERKIYKNFTVTIGCAEWNNLNYWTKRNGYLILRADTGFPQVGKLQYREFCKMYEVFFNYRFDYFKAHKITVGLGISYMHEHEIDVDSIYFNPDPPHDYIIYSHEGNGHYWGIVPVLKYDYLFLKNRVAVGVDLRYRKYFGLFSSQIDYGFHAAFNF